MLHPFFTFLIIIMTGTVFYSETAAAILFKSPLASQEEFQRYSLIKNQQSYTQWFFENSLSESTPAHTQILEFSQAVLQNSGDKLSRSQIDDWNTLRSSLDLNKADREILFMLAEKTKLKKEACRNLLLDHELNAYAESSDPLQFCQKMAHPLPADLFKQLEPRELLIVDGRTFSQDQIPKSLIEGKYQWRIISDQYEDRSFTGTPEEFAQQNFERRNWVNGTCDSYKLNHKNFSVLTQAQVFFSENCVQPGLPAPKTISSWAQDHKKLLWGVGILVGALTAYQLKDKTLVITRP